MPYAIPLHAILHPAQETGVIHVTQVAERVLSSFPDARADTAEGARWASEQIETARLTGVPEDQLEVLRRVYDDNVVYIAVPSQRTAGVRIAGYAMTMDCDLGDSLDLESRPYSCSSLLELVPQIAHALDCGFQLEHRGETLFVQVRAIPCKSPNDVVRELMFVRDDDEKQIDLVAQKHWQDAIRTAVDQAPTLIGTHERMAGPFQEFDTVPNLASAIIRELETIGNVERAWTVHPEGWPYSNAVLLDHGKWSSYFLAPQETRK